MRQHQRAFTVAASGRGLFEITREVARVVDEARIETGIAHVYCRHTSCSLIINENADPDVQRDLEAFFRRLVPDGDRLFVHTAEGPDDMPAHIRTALTAVSLAIPVTAGRLALGTWQGIYLFEHRRSPHERSIVVHVVGE